MINDKKDECSKGGNHEWGIDGMHSNTYCKKCFIDKPEVGRMKHNIGDVLIDEDGCRGIVYVKWDNGDLSSFENDAAHPNPILVNLDDTRKGEQ